jgi:DNA-directed RNA polymerase subunit E'/Rpb7
MENAMYERRELVRTLSVPSKYIQRSIQTSLLTQLKGKVEGRCGMEGYIRPDSVTLLEHSLGRISLVSEGVHYRVKFQADICSPHPGQVFQAPVMFRSKIGVHAELSPLKILLPRDLHIGNEEFEQILEKDTIEFEVLGSQFQQNDQHVFVLGKLVKRLLPAKSVEEPKPLMAPSLVEEEVSVQQVGDVKAVKVEEKALTAMDQKPKRRRRLVPPGEKSGVLQIDVPTTEGGP